MSVFDKRLSVTSLAVIILSLLCIGLVGLFYPFIHSAMSSHGGVVEIEGRSIRVPGPWQIDREGLNHFVLTKQGPTLLSTFDTSISVTPLTLGPAVSITAARQVWMESHDLVDGGNRAPSAKMFRRIDMDKALCVAARGTKETTICCLLGSEKQLELDAFSSQANIGEVKGIIRDLAK